MFQLLFCRIGFINLILILKNVGVGHFRFTTVTLTECFDSRSKPSIWKNRKDLHRQKKP